MKVRRRLDVVLVERGLAETRAKAQALILAGRVRSLGRRLEKSGERVESDAPLEVDEGPRWVGRGGIKLEDAIRRLGVVPAGRDALDVGASTGGFTEVLLAAGARRVVALDVGRGQLDWKLRNDPRVEVLEGRNARYLSPDDLPFRPTLATVDVSFISLERILPAVIRCLASGGEIVALVKPQFEVGRGRVGPDGVVRDASLHRDVLRRIVEVAESDRWGLSAIVPSVVKGAEGNVEFFVRLAPGSPAPAGPEAAAMIDRAVAEAHGERP